MKIAINGYGRIGRSFVRALLEREAGGWVAPFSLIAINDLGEPNDLLYLTRYDSVHGRLSEPVGLYDNCLQLGRHAPSLSQQENPATLPWQFYGVDLVLECTGIFRGYSEASAHLAAGAKQVLIGAVPFDRADGWLIGDVPLDATARQPILTAASCTTQAVVPVLRFIEQRFGIENVLLREAHAYTSDQALLDRAHRDPRRGRAAAANIVPTSCSAVGAVQQVLPQLKNKIQGASIRVPVSNVAMATLTLNLTQTPSSTTLQHALRELHQAQPNIIGLCEEPLVSTDFIHRPESAILDFTQLVVQGNLAQITLWYDNEWGYANRLLDTVAALVQTQ